VKTASGRADFTWTHGKHQLKSGVEVRPDLYDDANTLSSRGLFSFTGTVTGNAYADYLLGFTRTKTFGGGPGRVKNRDLAMGLYVSDQWRLTTRLTVTMGLRYEPYWQPYTYNLNRTNWYPDQYTGIGSLAAAGIVQGGVNGERMADCTFILSPGRLLD